MFMFVIFGILASTALAAQPGLRYKNANFTGVATFDDYAAQTNTVCGPKAGEHYTCGQLNAARCPPTR